LVIFALVGLSSQSVLFELQDGDVSKIKPCKSKDVKSCTVAKVDLDALDDDVVTIPECGDMVEKNLIQESYSRAGFVDAAKSVAFENDKCEAVFSFRGGKAFGNVDVFDGRDFVLEPCAAFEGCHVWKEEDTSVFVDGDAVPVPPTERQIFENRDANALRQQGIDDPDTIVTFSVKYYYTRQFAEVTDDIELYMDQVTAETNQGYINSLIPVRIKIHCIEPAELDDMNGGSAMLTAFQTYKGTVAELRGGADAAALILGDFAYCGIGYLDSWRTGNTVTAQQKACALGYFTMGHELGHNFGCHHDRLVASGAPYDYGYGSNIVAPYRTCMAYRNGDFNRKANIYSSPVATFQGVITGSATEDNARVIRENRFGMAAVGDESGTCDWVFSSTAAPTTQNPTTTDSPTVPTTTDNPGTTNVPTTTDISGTTNVPTTTDNPGTTDVPTTTGPGTGACREKDVEYTGTPAAKKIKRARNVRACENRCKKNKKCEYWTWNGPNKALPQKQRKRCKLFKTLEGSFKSDISGVVSGTPALC